MERNQILMFVMIFGLISTIVVNFGLFTYVAYHDEFFYRAYDVAEDLKNQSIISQPYLDGVEDMISLDEQIPEILDYLWLATFVSMVGSIWISSYFVKREGIFSVLGVLTFGIVILMFVGTIILEISNWINTLFRDYLLSGINLSTPFYSFYIDNYGVINLVIILVTVLINFVDFDLSKFGSRKNKEQKDEVI